MRITVLGGTGYGGAAVVAEAAKRGHQVRSVSRRPPAEPVAEVEYVNGSLLDEGLMDDVVAGADVVFEALSPRGDLNGKVEGVFGQLTRLAGERGFRLGVLGGASGVLIAEGGPRMIDAYPPADEHRQEAELGVWKLELLRDAADVLDWFYVHPAAQFGAWLPQRVTGGYRSSPDVLLTDEEGTSYIAAPDLALAVLDEIENPQHRRRRFQVAV